MRGVGGLINVDYMLGICICYAGSDSTLIGHILVCEELASLCFTTKDIQHNVPDECEYKLQRVWLFKEQCTWQRTILGNKCLS